MFSWFANRVPVSRNSRGKRALFDVTCRLRAHSSRPRRRRTRASRKMISDPPVASSRAICRASPDAAFAGRYRLPNFYRSYIIFQFRHPPNREAAAKKVWNAPRKPVIKPATSARASPISYTSAVTNAAPSLILFPLAVCCHFAARCVKR